MVGLLGRVYDQPVAEASTYTGQHNVYIQETNFHAPAGIRTPNPSNQVVEDLRHKQRGRRDRRSYHITKL
jgi:hypothetical protein